MKRWKRALLWAGTGNNLAYTNKVIALAPIAYWPLADASGATATDESGNARNGSYVGSPTLGVTGIGDGRTAATFNGTSSYTNIYSASLAGAFNSQEGTISAWFKVSAAGVWTDATFRRVAVFFVDNNNFVSIHRTSTNNQLRVQYGAGGTQKFTDASTSATGWLHAAVTWSKAADQLKGYLSGAQFGSTQTGLGTWAGSLSSTGTLIGALATTPSQLWSGDLAHVAIFTSALSAANVLALATVP